MRIEIEDDVIEFVPETREEAMALGRLAETVLEAARADRKIVPQNEYLACVAGPMKLVVRDR